MVKIPHRKVSLIDKRNNIREIEDSIVKRNSFSDIVSMVNKVLVERYKERIVRKNYNLLLQRVSNVVKEFDLHIPGIPHKRLVEQIVDSITGYDILHQYIANKNITNIEIEDHNNVYVMENLKWKKAPINFESPQYLKEYVHRLFNRLGGRFTYDNPLARIEDPEWNLRIRAGGFDVSPDSTTLSIRKLRKEPLGPKEIRYSMSQLAEEFLRFAVKAGLTIGVVGPFGSGKTTLLATLLSWIPKDKHINLIQSSNEIQKVHPFMRRRIVRNNNTEEGVSFGEIDLLKFAKQESPDVIALGEFLDEAALTMLHILQLEIQALYTYHANTARGAVHAFNFMAKQGKNTSFSTEYLIEELANYMDIVIIMDRLKVKEIIQYSGEIDRESFTPKYTKLFEFNIEKEDRYELIGELKRNYDVPLYDKLLQKAKWSGVKVPEHLGLIKTRKEQDKELVLS